MFELILRFSLEANKWIAPDFDEILGAINKKQEAIHKNAEAGRRNADKRFQYERKKKWAWFYKLIGKKLVEPDYEKVVNIFSVMPINPDAPVVGLRFMMDNGYLEIENVPPKSNILQLNCYDIFIFYTVYRNVIIDIRITIILSTYMNQSNLMIIQNFIILPFIISYLVCDQEWILYIIIFHSPILWNQVNSIS